jgi:hypothetical protein
LKLGVTWVVRINHCSGLIIRNLWAVIIGFVALVHKVSVALKTFAFVIRFEAVLNYTAYCYVPSNKILKHFHKISEIPFFGFTKNISYHYPRKKNVYDEDYGNCHEPPRVEGLENTIKPTNGKEKNARA